MSVSCPYILLRSKKILQNTYRAKSWGNLEKNHSEGKVHLPWTKRLDNPMGDESPSVDEYRYVKPPLDPQTSGKR